MQSKPNSRGTRWCLVASLLAGVAAAHAADGVRVEPQQERLVRLRMSPDQVEQVIGQPFVIARHGFASGRTWSYEVDRGPMASVVWFDVNFDANGAVASVDERAQ